MNGMPAYNHSYRESTDDPNNLITLRCDLHRLLDHFIWVLFPTNDGYAVHFLEDTTALSAYASFHRQSVALPDRIPSSFLYARFAYNILGLVKRIVDPAHWEKITLPDWAVSISPTDSPQPPSEHPDSGREQGTAAL